MMLRCSIGAVVLASGFCGHYAFAQTVTLAPPSTHPAGATTLTGTGFADKEAVDVYIDTTDTLLLVSSATGTLSGAVTVPASAAPGVHYVTAVGRHAGDAAQAELKVTTPWLESGYGAASMGWNPYENTIGTNNVASLGTLWQLSNIYDSGAAPAVTNGRVYNATFHGIQALNTSTGAVSWTALPTIGFYSSPAIASNMVYAGSSGVTFYALNATTGATVWTATLGSAVNGSPVVAGGVVYLGCYDKNVYALNASTGQVIWSYATGSPVDGSPAVVGGVVYIGSEDDSVYALNAATGALVWSYKTGGEVEAGIVVADGVALAASDDGKIYALRTVGSPLSGTTAGTVLWSDSGADFETPAYSQGTVFYGSSVLYAVDARTGAQRWSFTPDSAIRGRTITANGLVYFTSTDGILYALNAVSGAELFHTVSGSAFLGGPSISDGVVYVNAFETGTSAYAVLAGTNLAPRLPPRSDMLRPDPRLTVSR